MGKVFWLIAGNKGGVGKSTVASAFIEWLASHNVKTLICDGDSRTPDVAQAYCLRFSTKKFDLHNQRGWEETADWLLGKDGHVVANLPDGVSDRAIKYFQDFKSLANSMNFEVKMLFVMNTLSDGISMIGRIQNHIDIIPVKNLIWGKSSDFRDFNTLYNFGENVILFPPSNKVAQTMLRDSSLSLTEFISQKSRHASSNILSVKASVACWLQTSFEAFEDILIGDIT